MASNLEDLVRTAAQLRASGLGWRAIAATVRRKESTVKGWPRAFAHHWKKYYEQSVHEVREEACTEAIAMLRNNLRSDDLRAQSKAIELAIDSRKRRARAR